MFWTPTKKIYPQCGVGKWGFFGPIINTIKVVPNAQNGVNGAFLGPK